MSWHRAAAVLALAVSPALATTAHAKSGHRHDGAAHVRQHSGHQARQFAEHRRDIRTRRYRTARAASPVRQDGNWGPASYDERYANLQTNAAPVGRPAAVGRPAFASEDRAVSSGLGLPNYVEVAERYRGTNPTGRGRAWCAVFANMILERTGHSGSGSALARSFASYGRPAPGPVPGAIAVFPHHVGFVVGSDGPGRIRIVSGNHSHRVGEGIYPARRVIAYRYPA